MLNYSDIMRFEFQKSDSVVLKLCLSCGASHLFPDFDGVIYIFTKFYVSRNIASCIIKSMAFIVGLTDAAAFQEQR